MKSKITVLALSLSLLGISKLNAQGGYQIATNVPVKVNGTILKNPWVGGFNAPIFSEIDLNGDGIKDLFVFDKAGNRVTTYINNGTPNQVDYSFAPEYKLKFPEMHDWTLLKDFNCDGLEDIFTLSYNAGMTVYRNDYTIQNGLKFVYEYPLVMSQYGTVNANLYVSPVNLPALVDVDYDGDLDVLTFPVTGNYVEFHKNRGQELFGKCDTLVYQIEPNCFGNFGLSGLANEAVFNVSCRLSENPPPAPQSNDFIMQVQHSGSCMIAVDLDGDNDYDLLNGDILGDNILYVENGGNSTAANMVAQDTAFPSYDVSVDMFTFPAPYYFDVDNDGNKDFISAPCINGPAENFNNVWYYHNTTNNQTNVFNFQKNRFLVDEMIEVGTGAKVVFHDLDADGLLDMVIGNYGYYDSILPFNSGISFYRNTGTSTSPAFDFVTDDFGGLFSLSLIGISPAFGDIDNDGDDDMFIGYEAGELLYYMNTAGPGNPSVFTLVSTQLLNSSGGIIDVGNYSVPQIVDVNRDGLLDLLIGAKSGRVHYYENTGTASNFQFTLVTPTFGGVLVNNSLSLYGYSYPCLVDSSGDYQLLVGAINGYIYQYTNIDNNLNGTFTLTDSMYYSIHEPERVSLSVADLDNDGYNEILTGNEAGGVTLYKFDTTTGVPSLDASAAVLFNLYPNPAGDVLYIKFENKLPGEKRIQIIDVAGQIVADFTEFNNVTAVNTNSLANGVYTCRVIDSEVVTTKKFIISH